MISFDDIVIITHIYEKRNFSAAAESIYVGQSTLSRKIKKVEEELGYTIFKRGRGDREISLTERGKRLIPMLYEIKSIYKDICNIKYFSERKNFRIASTDGPLFLAIDSVVETLLSKNDKFSFTLHTANFNECIDSLIMDYADIAFVGKVSHAKNIKFTPLYREEICLVAKQGIFKKNKVQIKDLNLENAVISPYSDDLMNWLGSMFGQRSPLIKCDLNSELERFILSKNLWSFVPISLARELTKNDNIRIFDFKEELPTRIIYYATKQSTPDVATEELLNEIRNELRKFAHITVYTDEQTYDFH